VIPRVSAIAASLPELRLALDVAHRGPAAALAAATAMPAANPPARQRVVPALDVADGAQGGDARRGFGAVPGRGILA